MVEKTARVISHRIATQVVPVNRIVKKAITASGLLGKSMGRGFSPLYSIRDLYIIAAAVEAEKAVKPGFLVSVIAELDKKMDDEVEVIGVNVSDIVGEVVLEFDFEVISATVESSFLRVLKSEAQ